MLEADHLFRMRRASQTPELQRCNSTHSKLNERFGKARIESTSDSYMVTNILHHYHSKRGFRIAKLIRLRWYIFALIFLVSTIMSIGLAPIHFYDLVMVMPTSHDMPSDSASTTERTLRAGTENQVSVTAKDEMKSVDTRDKSTSSSIGLSSASNYTRHDFSSHITFTETNFSGVIARPFHRWPRSLPLPCFPPEHEWWHMDVQGSPTQYGFLYLKPYKTGSSTTSGINLRIARNEAKRQNKSFPLCQARFDHGPQPFPALDLFGSGDKSKPRIRGKSMLWTIIRDPTKRAISQFFHFEVSRFKREPTDENFIDFLRGGTWFQPKDYYLRALHPFVNYDRESYSPRRAANDILKEYDFIGITERQDESVVALSMLLNLPLADVLYVSAKSNGGFDDGGEKQCSYIWKSFVTPGMKKFFASREWLDIMQHDLSLYQAAYRSLDLTIDRLGREPFEKKLKLFLRAQSEIQTRCAPTAAFPCGPGGESVNETDCLWKDSGCATSCVDQIANELHLWGDPLIRQS